VKRKETTQLVEDFRLKRLRPVARAPPAPRPPPRGPAPGPAPAPARQPRPDRELPRHRPGHLARQPGLARPARPGHRHQPELRQQARDLPHRPVPADSNDRRGTSRESRSPALIAPIAPQGRAEATEGSRRKPFLVDPVTATPAGKGIGESRERCGVPIIAWGTGVPRIRARAAPRGSPVPASPAWPRRPAPCSGGGVRFVPLVGERAASSCLPDQARSARPSSHPGPPGSAVRSRSRAWRRR
jgi:hypothetical protein